MNIPNLHDRRALEEIVARLDTESIVRELEQGGLSAFAADVAAQELARRVIGDDLGCALRAGSRAWRVFDRTVTVLVTAGYFIWAAWLAAGLFR